MFCRARNLGRTKKTHGKLVLWHAFLCDLRQTHGKAFPVNVLCPAGSGRKKGIGETQLLFIRFLIVEPAVNKTSSPQHHTPYNGS